MDETIHQIKAYRNKQNEDNSEYEVGIVQGLDFVLYLLEATE